MTLCRRLFLVLLAGTLAADCPLSAGEPEPVFSVRELYAPGHFGNSYEVLREHEMWRVLEEAVYWGFNRYGDWFDMEDCSDPFAQKRLIQLADVMWEAKKTNFRTAQSLGMACDLIITPNHVYVDQCLPELKAEAGGRIFGQLICPSKPAARNIILANYENLFADLAEAGVRLSAICPCPYDFGGCACEKCSPWILTYARLAHEIHQIALKYHPGVEMRMIGWWWSSQEHDQFADWVDAEAPGSVNSMFLHILYGQTDVNQARLPKDCRRGAFVHIGYADQAQPRDVYGHLGPVIAASRLEQTVRDLHDHGVTEFMAYSEGVFDDVNKALLAGLGSGKFSTADEVLAAYAKRYFHVDDAGAARWAAWLKQWGVPFSVDTDRSAQELAELLNGAPPGDWRRRQWELKQELFRLNGRIVAEKTWTPARLANVDRFWDVHEQIQRGLWGLALLRHCFDRRYTPVPWYAEWAKQVSHDVKAIGKEQ